MPIEPYALLKRHHIVVNGARIPEDLEQQLNRAATEETGVIMRREAFPDPKFAGFIVYGVLTPAQEAIMARFELSYSYVDDLRDVVFDLTRPGISLYMDFMDAAAARGNLIHGLMAGVPHRTAIITLRGGPTAVQESLLDKSGLKYQIR